MQNYSVLMSVYHKEQIQSADMTADWEAKLLRIERGEMEPEEFMTERNI